MLLFSCTEEVFSHQNTMDDAERDLLLDVFIKNNYIFHHSPSQLNKKTEAEIETKTEIKTEAEEEVEVENTIDKKVATEDIIEEKVAEVEEIEKIEEVEEEVKKEDVKETGYNYYIVEENDTLYSIAHKHNISIKYLQEINNLNNYAIHKGDKIIIRKTQLIENQ
jgi:LysM repeat protein